MFLYGYILVLAALLFYVTLAPCINYYKKKEQQQQQQQKKNKQKNAPCIAIHKF